jgi:hypothetical protein
MNLKAKPIFQKEDGIYKIIDDFTKIRIYEVDCAASCSHFKSSLGNVRQNWVGNLRIARVLNGAIIRVEDVSEDLLLNSMDFSVIKGSLAGEEEHLVISENLDKFSINKGYESKTLVSGMSWYAHEVPNVDSVQVTPLIQGIAAGGNYGQLNSVFTRSLQSTPSGPAAKSKHFLAHMLSSEGSGHGFKWIDSTQQGSCANLEMVSCEDYPRSIEVHDFSLFNELRYSCGWKLSLPPDAGQTTVTYVYDVFDIHMVYELTLQTRPEERPQSAGILEGLYTATIMMPTQTRDLKKHIYDTVRREARVWDDILHLCHLLINRFNSDWLKDYLRSHRSLVVDEFVHYLGDQKSAK